VYVGRAYYFEEDNEIERMLRRKSKSPISTESSAEQFSAFHRGTGVSKMCSEVDYTRLGAHLNDGTMSLNTSLQQRCAPAGEHVHSKVVSSPMSNSSGMISHNNLGSGNNNSG